MKRWHDLVGEILRFARRSVSVPLLLALLATPTLAAAISQGYKTNETLSVGSLVGSDPAASDTVRSSNSERVQELIGVVVATDGSLLAISSQQTNVQVATTGTTAVLVSNLNGDIKKGDPITASAINGVGAKATAAGRILGLADGDFNDASPGTVKKEVDTLSGKKSVTVGTVSVILQVGFYNPRSASDAIIPQSVQNLATLLAGKQVSTIRIVVAASLLLLGVIITFVILNSAIGSSMTSIGRNPLAKSAINRGLIKVLLFALAILLVTFASVYFVIKG